MTSCQVCGAEGASPCGGCGNVAYCGTKCQRKDWKEHKVRCRCYKITRETGAEHGNHVLASR